MQKQLNEIKDNIKNSQMNSMRIETSKWTQRGYKQTTEWTQGVYK
jgi:hypothetical protein